MLKRPLKSRTSGDVDGVSNTDPHQAFGRLGLLAPFKECPPSRVTVTPQRLEVGQLPGSWPQVFGMVFAASNVARLLLPLRFGAALAMAPWVDENIMLLGDGRR